MPQTTKKIDSQKAMKLSADFVLQTQSPREQVDPGIKRQLLGFNEEIMAARVWFDKGAVGQLHTHPHSQVAYIESGRFEVTVGGETKTLGAGDSFLVTPHIRHGAVCLEEGVLIDMFAPIREDFLAEKPQS